MDLKKDELFEVSIPNWEKYQGPDRPNRKRSWFRLDCGWHQDARLSTLPIGGKLLWLAMLELRASSSRVTFDVTLSKLGVIAYLRGSNRRVNLLKLAKLQLIEIRKSSLRTYERTNKQQKHRESEPEPEKKREKEPEPLAAARCDFNFLSLYEQYPRKEGKKAGLAKCRTVIKTPDCYAEVERAISNYVAHCAKTAKETKFIMHFSTFMNGKWEDWVDPPPELQVIQQPRMVF